MSLQVTITISDQISAGLAAMAQTLEDKTPLNQKLASDGEAFLKSRGAVTAAQEHRTANTLGATPTGHLDAAYRGIEGVANNEAALLLIPGATRLRAAFGSYVLTPKNGSNFLTIPVNRDAYGKRAREIPGLFPVRVGPQKTLTLSRRAGSGLEVMYVLVASATIPEDRSLIPFDDLEKECIDSAEEYLDAARERSFA